MGHLPLEFNETPQPKPQTRPSTRLRKPAHPGTARDD